jgi:hypothetical protein
METEMLSEIAAGVCFYGEGTSYLKAYVHEIPISLLNKWPLTAKDVLEIMELKNWCSEHNKDLNKTLLDYPGYHPYTKNDEIHTDFNKNYLFSRVHDPENYKTLKQYVREGIVWFVLYHLDEDKREVSLYAVGRSPFSNCLVGVRAEQRCHNLCD